MPYARTTWIDNTTLVDAAKMNNIETELVALDASDATQASQIAALQTADKTVTIGGSVTPTTDGNGGAAIPWGITVASVVSVVVCSGMAWNAPDMMVNVDDAAPPTTSGFTIRARNTATNVFVNNTAIRVQWLAVVVKP